MATTTKKSKSSPLSASSHIVTPMEENSFSSSDPPLFSCFITLSTLFLIYSPSNDSLRFLLSPVLLISVALLLSLLRLGSNPEPHTRPGKTKEAEVKKTEASDVLFDVYSLSEANQDSDTRQEFVEWDLRAPLEVIHESAYEEDEEDDDPSGSGEKDPTRFREMERYPSLSLCYPETDSGSDSDSSSEFTFPEMSSWMSPEKMGYRWEDEEDRGRGLIEIKLDDDEYNNNNKKKKMMDFHAEEEGLIEIDLFA